MHKQQQGESKALSQPHDRETCERCNRGLPCMKLAAKLDAPRTGQNS